MVMAVFQSAVKFVSPKGKDLVNTVEFTLSKAIGVEERLPPSTMSLTRSQNEIFTSRIDQRLGGNTIPLFLPVSLQAPKVSTSPMDLKAAYGLWPMVATSENIAVDCGSHRTISGMDIV